MKDNQHYHSLDGLRGLAALSVVFFHYAILFVPVVVGFSLAHSHEHLTRLIVASPLELPFAGNFAVCIFFVLSGFVLSLRFFQTGDNSVLASAASRRYFRLMIPAAGSVLLAYFLLRSGLMFLHPATLLSDAPNFLKHYYLFPAHLGQAVFQAVYGIWQGHIDLFSSYNSVLWTMHFELFGSFLIFMFLALFGKLKNRWVFYGLFALFFLKTYYLGFIAGIAMCDLFVTKPHLPAKVNEKVAWLGLAVSIVLGTWTIDGVYPNVYSRISVPFFSGLQLELFSHLIGAIIVVFAVLKLRLLARVLETKLFQYLGKVSFSLYLTHFLIMGSFSSYVFIHLLPHYGYKPAVLGACLLGLPVTFLVASLYAKLVDVPSIAASKRLGNSLLNGKLSGFSWRQPVRPGLRPVSPPKLISVRKAQPEDQLTG